MNPDIPGALLFSDEMVGAMNYELCGSYVLYELCYEQFNGVNDKKRPKGPQMHLRPGKRGTRTNLALELVTLDPGNVPNSQEIQ